MTDLFSEIEQDLRREQASKLWEKYGIYLAGAAVAIVLVAAAIVGWRAWQTSRNEAASARFDEIVAEAAKQKPEEAAKTFGDFAAGTTSGYAAMARMHQAASLTQSGDTKGAVAVYDEIAGQSGLSGIVQDMARIKAGLLLVDTASYDDMNARLASLDETDNPWRNNARELLGLAAYKSGKYAEAETNFSAIVADPSSTAGLRDRAHVMQALIAPHLPRPEEKTGGKNAATPTTSPTTNPTTNNAAPAQAAPVTKSE
ncbi:MAG: tetratricopeptide repeat protein [Parvibaculum sp.]|uniref:tetratricopeptide repeat protein n=1 Tax=Parvibaculum sp. TaxID=2024848 RepID=UPI0025EDD141|nr:tetratricopeptide repeat protein [Parvibaculum sp.]MCE9651061.1 tetratricopeptide repeat protein [Parvibaculum sp.]